MAVATSVAATLAKREALLARIEQARLAGELTPLEPVARIQSRQAFEQSMMDRYPGQFVAYRERWNGDELVPEVLARGDDYGEIDHAFDQFSGPDDRIITIFPA